jgi:hypothetical protein
MRNLAQTLPQPARPIGIDVAIGQIDLIGDSGEIVKSWRIRSPRCTVGSSPECSVQLSSVGISPVHATLIFGKKYTLLRSSGPTLISNRHVREWLIDHSTEIVVGQSRLIVHPSLGGVATVVHAEHLIDQAAKLRKEPAPVVPPQKVALSEVQTEPLDTVRLDTIEQLLQSLQVSLDKMQASLCTDAKLSNEAIVESVSQEIDEFGKRLFTNLNDQLSKESGTQQSRFSELANQFTDRFGAIDERLTQFSDATSQQTSTLNELLAQATSEQEQIEARFQELISHRDELVDAVQVLRSEIAIAYESQSNPYNTNQYNTRPNDVNEYADAVPMPVDYENSDCSQFQSSEQFEVVHEEEAMSPVVTDEQLADSLEQAQFHIQDLNAQLRQLEMERDSAQQRVENLSESWSYEQAAAQGHPEAEIHSESQSDAVESEPIAYEPIAYESGAYESGAYESVTNDKIAYQAEEAYIANDEELAPVEQRQLPAWFKQDLPDDVPQDREYTESKAQSFSVPDLSTYSDSAYDAEYPSESFERSERDDVSQESNDAKLDSISERLQRMLAEADQRRGPAKPLSESRTSSSWSQKFNASPTDKGPTSQSSLALQTAEPFHEEINCSSIDEKVDEEESSEELEIAVSKSRQLPSALRDLYREPVHQFESTENRLAAFIDSQEDRLHESGQADSANSVDNVEHKSQFSSADRNPEQAHVADENPTDNGEEESIEVYMQRLLHRVRGGSEDANAKSSQTAAPPIPTKAKAQATVSSPTKPRSRVAASMGLDLDDPETATEVEKLSEELFVPRQQTPERRNELDALRELANTNARRAISRSDIRRTNSAFIAKLGVTGLAVTSAVALFLFNGFSLNAPFVGMVSAIIVAGLWGYDCVNHFRLLKNGTGMHQATAAETAAGQSIRMSSSEENGWRPSQE